MFSPHHHHQQVHLLLSVFFALAFFTLGTATASSCNRSCSGSSLAIPYPFGFSDGCPIRLKCSGDGKVKLGNYAVRGISSENVTLDVTPSCNGSVPDIGDLFSDNYAMTAVNVLFLGNCSSLPANCSISTDIISQPMKVANCRHNVEGNISCYSSGRTEGFLSKENVEEYTSKCEFLFAPLLFGLVDNDADKSTLLIGAAEIGWWLNGKCRCDAHASCKNFSTPGNHEGFRCTCKQGFVGDGFADGDGCRAQKKHDVQVGILIGGVVIGASLALGIALLCYYICCRSTKTEESTQFLLSETSCTIAVYSHKDVVRATDNFSDAQKLGSGAYATVYMGRFSNTSCLVAIKKLKHPDTDNMEHVINEIKLVSSVSHPNLVHLLGCCVDGGHHILIYEFMPNGTLSQHLHRERGDGLSWSARVAIATGTARAIAYLHTAVHPPIYHRDIKSSNILLDYEFRPKVADFGLSRAIMVDSSHISTAPQGTLGYVDPQYHQNFQLSDKSDVYSFGVVLVEMITAMKVVDFGRAPTEVNLASMAADRIGKGLVEEIVDPIIKENWDGQTKASVQKVAELAFRCLAFHKEARPSMAEVTEEMERIRIEMGSSAQKEEFGDRDDRAKSVVMDEVDVVSPVSDQEQWTSERSCTSSSSLSNASFGHLNRNV
ncbi:wall-associated receptor kinase-like 14 [Canna indica]|uniref:Wall-associated receptor kinase-like 14 n=1 Tax=Canna indica TaxID=4628 RepID=A0AAQ3KDD0_9LILI|nr:wall-associated receptor kinase-like 14 [Canna indica]